MATTHRRTWQKAEGRAAALFGARRQRGSGSGGRPDETCSDSTHDRLYLECKLREKHAVVTLWDECKADARKEHKVPVVVLMEKGRPGQWLMVHSEDLDTLIVERLAAMTDDESTGVLKRLWAIREG